MWTDTAQVMSGMQQAATQANASMSVLAKTIDAAETQGAQMNQLLVSAGAAATGGTDAQIAQGLAITDPALGGAVDFSV